MKRILFSLLCAGLMLSVLSVKGQDTTAVRTYYANVNIGANGAIYFDIGDYKGDSDNEKITAYSVVDDYGNLLKTGGLAQALNFLADKGWELVTVATYGQSVYILKRKVNISGEKDMRKLLLSNLNVKQYGGTKK